MYCSSSSSLPFFPPVAEGLKFMLEVEDDEDWLQSDTTEDDEDSTRWAGQPFFFFSFFFFDNVACCVVLSKYDFKRNLPN